jgi:2-polyprenyl-3-methyl-5-hydroxy-6-metoxy-1,4-benzoquinol methylase
MRSQARLVRELYDREAARDDPEATTGFMGWLARRDTAAMLRLLSPLAGEAALDVGCGGGAHARLLKRAGLTVCAVDVSPRVIERIAPWVDEARVADLEALDLPRQFDCIVCVGVLDYVHDADRCLRNLAAHLRVGGRLVVEAPRRSVAGRVYRWLYRTLRGIHVNLFDRRALDATAARSGLEPVGYEQPFLHSLFIGWTRHD